MALRVCSGQRYRRIAFHPPAGFTLLEVLISMAVFSIGLLALAAMSTVAIKGNSAANRLTVATTLVEAKLAEVEALSYGRMKTTYETPLTDTPASNLWATRTVTMSDGPEAGMKQIDVQVSWTGADGVSRSVTLSGLHTNPQ